MQDVISQAHAIRFKAPDNDPKKDSIVVSEQWMVELNKHSYFSSKPFNILLVKYKAGKGVFLLKERAKL
jgi:hypothetical protein